MELICAKCHVHACGEEPGSKPLPRYCPNLNGANVLDKAHRHYQSDEQTRRIARSAAQVEAIGYCRWPRV